MKKLIALTIFISGSLLMVSCGGDDDPIGLTDQEKQEAALAAAATAVGNVVTTDASAAGMSATEITTAFGWTASQGRIASSTVGMARINVTANIAQDETWTSDNIYQLDGRITVLDGATLTIEAGTRLEGNADLSGENAAVLMIARGGMLMANGTAQNPIIMTSTADDGTLTADDKGKWGGLVILGKAPVSAKVDNPQIEGVPADDTNGLYGGTDAADNSGTIRYVSIRHGGAIIDAAAGDEINGLTLGGVGSGTTIEYVEVYANSDDGIEFFGGTVDVDYALVAQVGDDALDVDQSYAGTVTNFAVYVDENSDEGLEIDGREGDLDDTFTLTKGTITAVGGASITCDFKSKAKGSVSNLNANGGTIKLSASFDSETFEQSEDAAQNVVNGSLTFSSVNAAYSIYTTSFDE
ncbi:MAG: hypothetical protein RIM99_03100 [Cyclobacteriaceae bacterium]